MIARVAVSLLAAAIALVLAEGVFSLATGRSLIWPSPYGRMHALDEERIAAAALTVGPFARDDDPLVGFHVKASAQREFLGVVASTDRHGMRKRLGPEPTVGAVRIAILGDSVAFGFGVPDDATLGHHLEQMLTDALPADAPRPFVTTVACPGWNFTNQSRYFLNHVARVDPDIVVILPIGNDLDDGYTVTEAGQRDWPRAPGRPFVGVETWTGFVLERMRTHGENIASAATWPLLMSDLSPESQRRWNEHGVLLEDLVTRLRARGARSVVAFAERDEFSRMLNERLVRTFGSLRRVGLHGPREAADCIEGDPHPNGRWFRESARLIAHDLIDAGWIPSADASRLPEGDERYAARRFDPSTWSLPEEHRDGWYALYGAAFDRTAGRGLWQVYGGVDPSDGTVGVGCFLGLRADGATRLVARITPLPADSGVYPLTLSWQSRGREFGRTEFVPIGSDPVEVEIGLPSDLLDEGRLDVSIVPNNWVREVHRGRSRLAAFRLESIELR